VVAVKADAGCVVRGLFLTSSEDLLVFKMDGTNSDILLYNAGGADLKPSSFDFRNSEVSVVAGRWLLQQSYSLFFFTGDNLISKFKIKAPSDGFFYLDIVMTCTTTSCDNFVWAGRTTSQIVFSRHAGVGASFPTEM
jgi:hypothetical protein